MRPASKNLTWPDVLAALKACTASPVLIRDGKTTVAAAAIRSRRLASGSELCLFPGADGATREGLVRQLEAQAKSAGRTFMRPARANVGEAHLLVASVTEETIDGTASVVVETQRTPFGFNASQLKGDTTTLRSKPFKQWG